MKCAHKDCGMKIVRVSTKHSPSGYKHVGEDPNNGSAGGYMHWAVPDEKADRKQNSV